MNGQFIYDMKFSLKMGEHKVTDKDVVRSELLLAIQYFSKV